MFHTVVLSATNAGAELRSGALSAREHKTPTVTAAVAERTPARYKFRSLETAFSRPPLRAASTLRFAGVRSQTLAADPCTPGRTAADRGCRALAAAQLLNFAGAEAAEAACRSAGRRRQTRSLPSIRSIWTCPSPLNLYAIGPRGRAPARTPAVAGTRPLTSSPQQQRPQTPRHSVVLNARRNLSDMILYRIGLMTELT